MCEAIPLSPQFVVNIMVVLSQENHSDCSVAYWVTEYRGSLSQFQIKEFTEVCGAGGTRLLIKRQLVKPGLSF